VPLNYIPSFEFEQQTQGIAVGLDEAGMGCWAGDVFAAAAYVPQTLSKDFLSQIHDSKNLTAKKRQTLFQSYQEMGIQFFVACASLQEIEQLNIRGAALLAMERAYEGLGIKAELALVDGTMQPKLPCQVQSVVKGDQRSYSIAAASIAVKVSRDQYMQELDALHPEYGWADNAGYGTKKHQQDTLRGLRCFNDSMSIS
jgi:ribonuclease HII